MQMRIVDARKHGAMTGVNHGRSGHAQLSSVRLIDDCREHPILDRECRDSGSKWAEVCIDYNCALRHERIVSDRGSEVRDSRDDAVSRQPVVLAQVFLAADSGGGCIIERERKHGDAPAIHG